MRRTSDEIDYELIGDDLQAVIVTLDPGETVIAEAGAMMFMEDGIEMNTTLDPNKQGGGVLGKLFAGAKRVLSGDTFFITTFLNAGRVRRRVAFSSHFPGKIKPVDLLEWGGTIIAQKDSFLCAPKGTNVDIAFTRRIGAGFFGGEGLFFATLSGPGRVMLQTMPFSRLADRILAAAPRAGGRQMQESGGSALGVVGGVVLGGLLGGRD